MHQNLRRKILLKDLFFNIWYQDIGIGWIFLFSTLFFLYIAIIVFIIAYQKAHNKKFTHKHILFFIIASIIMYQMIPISADFLALSYSTKNKQEKAVQFEHIAIKTAMISWQKGAYYCNLATIYRNTTPQSIKKAINAYQMAYKLIKDYKYDCWYWAQYVFYDFGDYDTAIEIAKNRYFALTPNYALLTNCYILKKDFKTALTYINKSIENKKRENAISLATKAYILKQLGNKKEAKNLYKRALEISSSSSIEKIKAIYKDFIGYEKKQQELILSEQNQN